MIRRTLYRSLAIPLILATALALPAQAAGPASGCKGLLKPAQTPKGDFARFLNGFSKAVAGRDAKAVEATFTGDITLNVAEDIKVATLNLADRNAPAWRNLDKALALGCISMLEEAGTTWECPGLDTRSVKPFDDFTENSLAFVPGKDVPVRAQPAEDAAVLQTLSCTSVRLNSEDDIDETKRLAWAPVLLADGRKGYMPEAAVYVPFDYRLIFEKRKGVWRATAFVAGD